MLDFTFNDSKYSLPQAWSEVTLDQLKQFIKLDREDLSGLERAGRVVSIMSGIDYEIISGCDTMLVINLMSHLGFLDTEAEIEPIEHFTLSGVTYYVNTLQNSIFKEFATFSKIESDFKDNPEDAYSLKLAVLCRKDGETFTDVEDLITERAKLFDQLDAVTVLKINSFFLTKLRLLSLNLDQFSELENLVKEKEAALLERMTINTAGLRWLSQWQVVLYRKIKSLIKRLYKY